MTGKRFGKLVVVERAEDYCYKVYKNGKIKTTTSPYWLCLCDCGNYVTTAGGYLRNGTKTHCGCSSVYSKGELIVAEFLTENNIVFQREYSFNDLHNISGRLLRFDFALFSKSNIEKPIMLVEYQGEQHYLPNIKFGLYQRKYTDKMKADYCRSHNIPLFEIRYDDDLSKSFSNMINAYNEYKEK